jgi:hypothetical protein
MLLQMMMHCSQRRSEDRNENFTREDDDPAALPPGEPQLLSKLELQMNHDTLRQLSCELWQSAAKGNAIKSRLSGRRITQ